MRIEIKKKEYQTIEKHVTNVLPKEGCGLLIGFGNQVISITDVIPSSNRSTDKNKFLVDPKVQFDCIRNLRGSPYRIVGHYHSHPNGKDIPSLRDRTMIHDMREVWLICSFDKDGKTNSSVYFPTDRPKKFEKAEFSII